jgi:hypothetical protein
MKALSKATGDAQKIARLEKKVATLETPRTERKLARSKANFDRAVADGLSPVEVAFAASSCRLGTAKGEIALWLLKNASKGKHTVAAIRKGIARAFETGFAPSAAQVDVALGVLADPAGGFNFRPLVGYSLSYDPQTEIVEISARKARVSGKPKAARKAKVLENVPAAADEKAA